MADGEKNRLNMFKLINIFKRENNVLKVYRCFQSVENNCFFVQSMDFFHEPLDVQSINNSNLQLLELFMDECPTNRIESFPTIEDAIKHFDEEFNEL